MDKNQENKAIIGKPKPNQANDQKQVEEAVSLSGGRLSSQTQSRFQRSIITNNADGILVLDNQGIIRFVNPAAEELFGRSAKELLGSPFGFPLVAGETTELDILRRHQAPIVTEMRVAEIVWEESIGLLASLRDVTKRKQHEIEIEERNVALEQDVEEGAAQVNHLNERLNAIFNTAKDVIVLVGENGYIEIANPALTRKFGYLPDEVSDQPLANLVIPSQQESLNGWIKQIIIDSESQRQQVIGISKEGLTFDMEVSFARVRDTENHVVCVFHDISHFKAVGRMKDNFISMVSHELRSPVTSLSLISGALQTFYDRYTEDQVRQKLADLNNQCQVLMELIESVLDISRLEDQKGKFSQLTTVDMSATARNTLTELQFDIKNKSHTVVAALPEQPITLLGDQLDFVRIWRNLLSNAIKYTPQGGKISVRLACAAPESLASSYLSQQEMIAEHLVNGRLYIIGQVEDNGHGIGADDFPNLFQRFNRGWAHKSNIPGTGLGLALVRELLTLYDGDICVSSQLGQGSVFTFWLPVPSAVA